MFSIAEIIIDKLKKMNDMQREWFYGGIDRLTQEELDDAKKILEQWDREQKEKTTLHILKEKEIIQEERNITCCFSGRREIPIEKEKKIKKLIKKEIKYAIKNGYKIFLSGFAEGADLLAAETVIALQKRGYDIVLKAYLPYKKKKVSERVKKAMEHCQQTWAVQEYNTRGCYHQRNRYMVEHSTLLIAIIDQKEGGGTAYTLNYAQKRDLQINKIYF